jgi:hypothetical protein
VTPGQILLRKALIAVLVGLEQEVDAVLYQCLYPWSNGRVATVTLASGAEVGLVPVRDRARLSISRQIVL